MKRHAPATARNRESIAKVLAGELPKKGRVLEIASGSGEHAVYFADLFSGLEWLPSDPDRNALESIRAWIGESDVPNIAEPVFLDASATEWPVDRADAIFCCNMVHISPWTATEGLFAGAAVLLLTGAPLIVYGPFLERDVDAAPSNLAFDRKLKERNPAWGLRSIEALDMLAEGRGFNRTSRVEMPANNLTLTYRRI